MADKRLSKEERAKNLRLGIIRIEKGRSRSNETKVTFASVSRETGVSTALIHNHHPDIAEEIREKQGRSSRAQRDAKHTELVAERDKNRKLRSEIGQLRSQVAKLASINEVLSIELRDLRARSISRHIVDISSQR